MSDEAKTTEEKVTKSESKSSSSGAVYYILGALIVVAVLAGAYFLRPQAPTSPSSATQPATTGTQQQSAQATPKKQTGPITKLACDSQYYNPVVGFPTYYLSVDGVDVDPATTVDCTFTATANGKVVATDSAQATLEDEPTRGGKKFRCTTKAMEVPKNLPTKVDVSLSDDAGATAKCSYTFLFP